MRPSEQFGAMEAAAAAQEGDRASGGAVEPCPFAKRVKIRIVVKDRDYVIHRHCKYVLYVGGKTFAGTTGDSGIITHRILESAREGLLEVWLDGPRIPPEEWLLDIEPFAPAEVGSGLEARLGNLGFTGVAREQGRTTLAHFQSRVGATVGSEQSDETQTSLAEIYSASDGRQRDERGWWMTDDVERTSESGGGAAE